MMPVQTERVLRRRKMKEHPFSKKIIAGNRDPVAKSILMTDPDGREMTPGGDPRRYRLIVGDDQIQIRSVKRINISVKPEDVEMEDAFQISDPSLAGREGQSL